MMDINWHFIKDGACRVNHSNAFKFYKKLFAKMNSRITYQNNKFRKIILPNNFKITNNKINLKEQEVNLRQCISNLETLVLDSNQEQIKLRFISSKIKTFKKNIKLMNIFCKKFPYSDFINKICSCETEEIRLYSLVIFSRCTFSKYFPVNSISKLNYINFLISLFSVISEKYHKYIFTIFSAIVVKRIDVRKYLMDNGIFEFIDMSIPCERFIISCLITPPKIPENIVKVCSLRICEHLFF